MGGMEKIPGQWWASKTVTVKAPSGSLTTSDCPTSIHTNKESCSCEKETTIQSQIKPPEKEKQLVDR